MLDAERWAEHTRRLPPLTVGDTVHIQNQIGLYPRKWDKSGVVVEVRQFDQYLVRVDGSGRLTLRNRKFLRKYRPVYHRGTVIDDLARRPYSIPVKEKSSVLPTFPKPSGTHPGDTFADQPITIPDGPAQPTELDIDEPVNSPAPDPAPDPDTQVAPKPTPTSAQHTPLVKEAQPPPDAPAAMPEIRRSTRVKRLPQWTKDYMP